MTKRMLIDATHAEETRVVVLDGNRLEDFDVETSTKRQLKGNIYLAKVVRVEPSLQAAFVEYGGNRHGFLAFSEIHPDYYQIPVADRQRLLEMHAEEARREEEEEERAAAEEEARAHRGAARAHGAAMPAAIASETRSGSEESEGDPAPEAGSDAVAETEAAAADAAEAGSETETHAGSDAHGTPQAETGADHQAEAHVASDGDAHAADGDALAAPDAIADAMSPEAEAPVAQDAQPETAGEDFADSEQDADGAADDTPPPETVGGSEGEDAPAPRMANRYLRNYKIQEVIRRRQILLIQVVKEERGTKGAALTTYISLAGRFCVLMPNSPRGGGISRKITSAADRRRLKEITSEMEIPRGMGLIVRTAGAARPKAEIKRDCEYLMRMWDEIREHTLRSVAPALIYEEASLIKRAIRDVYSRDVDDIHVDGEEGWKAAHEFMRMLMPSHARKVQMWRDPTQTLFGHFQVEAQLDAMLSPTVQLRSGGYLVINQTEALVAIDVNSGRSTRERGIEETALRTNMEAADEVARQLRLRDLAGLIVIDFIDMEQKKHNAMVERRIKEALKNDRARIQVGHISHFGLLEMSRQRLRPSLAETSFIPCPHCGGTGHVRSTESAAIHVLRAIEEEGAKRRAAEIVVHMAPAIAMFILNHKRERLREIELRHGLRTILAADDKLIAPEIRIERVRAPSLNEGPMAVTLESSAARVDAPVIEAEEVADEAIEDDAEDRAAPEPRSEARGEGRSEARGEGREEAGTEDSDGRKRRRRRRRGRGRGREEGEADSTAAQDAGDEPDSAAGEDGAAATEAASEDGAAPDAAAEQTGEDGGEAAAERARRRGRRGGRRRRRDGDPASAAVAAPGADQPEMPDMFQPGGMPYAGPTPADPFGGQAFDIFDVLERAEEAQSARERSAAEPAAAPPPAAPLPVAPASAAPEPAQPEAAQREAAQPDAAQPVAAQPEPAAPEPARPEPVAADAAPSQAAMTDAPPAVTAPAAASPVAHEAEAGEQEPAKPAAAAPAAEAEPEQPPAPVIQPVLVGGDAAPAEKKRGWWRR